MKKIVSVILALVMLASLTFMLASCTAQEAAQTDKVKVIDIPLTVEEYGFGVKKGDTELLTSLNNFMAEIKENGTYEEILNKYFVEGGVPTAVASAAVDTSKDQLVVATNAAFAPFEYKEGESYYGVDMEVMKAFADSIGQELVINNMDFNATCTSVAQGLCDIAASGLTINETRKEIIDFSTPYYNASQVAIVKGDDTRFDGCKTAADMEAVLNGYTATDKAGAQNGTTGYFYLSGDEEWGFAGYKCTTTGFDSGALAVQAMLNGSISFVVIDEAPAKAISKSVNG